jgi:ubiquinone/menaquinone biosynthesis C-methylase UbiE
MIAVTLFTWLQGADFYHDLHQRAVETLPEGEGKQWIDIGCGPGLVARLAAARGYATTGIDTSGGMVKAARRLAKWHRSPAQFQQGDLGNLPEQGADVVSAASLLAVLDDKPEGLLSLWRGVRAGGHLLVIEPTPEMTPENAAKLIHSGLPGKRLRGLKLWAASRSGRAVESQLFQTLDAADAQYHDLLGGVVGAWVFRKPV